MVKCRSILILLSFLFSLLPHYTLAQEDKKEELIIIQKGPKYMTNEIWKEAKVFSRYEGKIIRSIQPVQLDFSLGLEKMDNDLIQQGSKFIDKIHTKTKSENIQKHLFIKVGDTLIAKLIADNERFLRTIPYLQDARFVVKSVKNSDSVDVFIYTKDILEYSGMIGGLGPNRQKLGISNLNILGSGQAVGFNVMHEGIRKPGTGVEAFYKYQNILGSFINSTIEIGTISPNIYDKKEDEFSAMLILDRPLISQYKRWAGGLIIGQENAKNRYPDLYKTGIYDYKSGTFETWIGYNLGAKKYLENDKLKLKKFIAVRYFETTFFKRPTQIGQSTFDQRFNDNKGLLTSLTLFKQYYFKTRYLYGFGNTEDIPAGYNANITAGYYQQQNLNRPYIGLNFYNYAVTNKEDLTSIFFRTGAFYQDNKVQDIGLLVGASVFSRIFEYKEIKIRNYFRLNYGTLIKKVALDPLRINNIFGLYGVRSDLASGSNRLSLRTESYYFLPYKVNGFNMAPISIIDLSYLHKPQNLIKYESGLFFALGAGLRMKNENLGINEIEIRMVFLPSRLAGEKYFNFSIITDLDFKYRGNYINKPRLIELNSDLDNHIF